MKLLTTIPFEIYEEGEFADQYPQFQNGTFIFPFNIEKNNENKQYILTIKPNYFIENADLTITDENEEAVILNLPINTSEGVDFFQGILDFNQHKLIYNNIKKQFEIWSLNE